MRVIITGAKGLLGSFLKDYLENDFSIFAFSKEEFDITDLNGVLSVVEAIRPDVLINCAAYTDVDGAEKNYKRAFLVNGYGPRNLAIASSKYGFHLIHFSTNYVFDGNKKRPYLENDLTNPINTYGESKLSGEKEILTFTDNFSILRISWLYGVGGKGFPGKLLRRAGENSFIKVVRDMFCSPTSVRTVGDAVKFIIENGFKGIFHCSSEGYLSFYEYSLILKSIFNFRSEIIPIFSKEIKYVAPRPEFSILESFLLKKEGFNPPNYREELLNFFKTYGKI